MSTLHLDDDDKPRTIDVSLWRRVIQHARPYRGAAIRLSAAGLVATSARSGRPRTV